MSGRRLRRIGATVVMVIGVAVIVVLATGEVALVTTHGVSMLPRFHTGDLAVIIPSSQYRVGEIVGYQSPLLHITVLHRIVAEHAGLFTFKGDHNSFRDPIALPASAIRGQLWLRLPHVGTVLGWVRSPVGLGLLAFLVVALGVVGLAGTSRRQRSRNRAARPKAGANGEGVVRQRAAARSVPVSWWPVAVLLALTGVLGLLTAASWSRPTTRESERPVAYDQHVAFSYEATASPGVTYPTGSVVTKDPVFLRLVSTLNVEARYVFDVTSPRRSTHTRTAVSGTIGAKAVLQGPGGWRGQLVSVAPASFSGSAASVDIPIDISQITSLETEFTKETGLPLETTNIVVTPTVRIHGFLDGAPVADTFAPPLALEMSGGVLNLVSASTSGTTPGFPQLTPHRSGSVGRPIRAAARMSVLGRSIDVLAARRTTLGGLIVMIVAIMAECIWILRRRRMDEPTRIRAAYGHELVAVSASPATSAQLVVDVETFGELARLARRYECVILEHAHFGGHAYYVECGATIYRCGTESTPDPPRERTDDVDFSREALLSTAAEPVAVAASDIFVSGSSPRSSRRRPRSTRPQLDADIATVAGEVDLLTSLAKAEWLSGVGDPSTHLHEAASLAKTADLDQPMIEALLVNVRTAFDEEQESDPEKIELLEYSLGLPDWSPAVRARVLGVLAVELIFVRDTIRRGRLLDEARELARRSCDPRALVEASACHFLARPRSNWSTGQLALDRAMFGDALDAAVTLGDPLWLATMQMCAASYALIEGDGAELRAQVETLSRTSEGGFNQVALRAQLLFEQVIANLEGRLGDADALSIEVDEAERSAGLADAATTVAKRQLALRREQGRLEELIPTFTAHLTAHPRSAASAAVLSFLLAETGHHHEAAIRLQSAHRADFRHMPDDADWPLAVAMWSEVAARTGDRDAAATLREMLLFHNGTQMWTSGISCGPAARLLANLEHVLGSAADADRHFAEAVESSRRINSPIWVARCQLDWAKTWILRGETVRAVQLIYAADAVTEALTLPALRQQSAMLRDQLGPC